MIFSVDCVLFLCTNSWFVSHFRSFVAYDGLELRCVLYISANLSSLYEIESIFNVILTSPCTFATGDNICEQYNGFYT